ncbi:MAG: ABC transporter substrate-binding protein, partial [Candidatus Solibacter sp.]
MLSLPRTAVAVVLAGLTASCAVWHAAPDTRTYRIGFQQAPPRQYVDAAGNPYGSSIDLLQGAADRSHVKLRWVLVPEGPDAAFRRGLVDIWPLVNQLPKRRLLHFSKPYAVIHYWLVSKPRAKQLIAAEISGRVAITEDLSRAVANQYLSRVQLEVSPSVPALIERICSDRIPVGIVGESAMHASLFRKPPDCTLQMSPIPGARLTAGVAAMPADRGAVATADRLREEISAMVNDGTFTTLSVKWFGYPTNEAALVDAVAIADGEVR